MIEPTVNRIPLTNPGTAGLGLGPLRDAARTEQGQPGLIPMHPSKRVYSVIAPFFTAYRMELSLMPSNGREPQGTVLPLAEVKKELAVACSAFRCVRNDESYIRGILLRRLVFIWQISYDFW